MPMPATTGRVRLQKFLSDAGVASRRHAEELILDGHVLVNDEVVAELPAFVDPRHDRVVVDGAPVRVRPLEYFLVHKPKGVVCTNYDPAGRRRAIDLLPPELQHLFPAGRLDEDSSGLLLMTNDGELVERITHPRFGVPKVYQAEVRGRVAPELPEQMKRGVYLAEGRARASSVEIVHTSNKESVLTITLREGRNRQVRRMLARLGHAVRKLKRLQIGPLSLKGLQVGAARSISRAELARLHAALGEAQQRPRKRRRPGQNAGPKADAGATSPRKPTAPARRGRSKDRGAAAPRRRIIS